MNFHKTIGYLAALLLMVGFGVPDSFAQSITLSVASADRSLRDDVAAQTVTVTATVSGVAVAADNKDRPITVTVNGKNSDASPPYSGGAPKATISVTIDAGKTSGSGTGDIKLTITGDDDAVDDVLTLTGTGIDGTANLTKGTVTITITDHSAKLTANAVDASGFRVIITAPAVGKWAKVGANQVKVQLLRRDGVASQFGNYKSIEVALRQRNEKGDGDDEKEDLYSLTVNDNGELGSLVLERVKTDSLTNTGKNTGASIVAYQRRSRSGKYDMLEFRFHIPNSSNADDMTRVYAQATFDGGGEDKILNSYDTENTIFLPNPSAYPDKVGDGKLIKIDRAKPTNNVIASVTRVITDKNKLGAGAGIGDEIEIKADVDGVFREHSVVFQIIVPKAGIADPTDTKVIVIKADGVLTGFAETFSATDIFSANGSLSHKFKVTANQFKRKYTANAPVNDPKKYKKNDLVEEDGMTVQVRASVKDKAGNSTAQAEKSAEFTLDSKPPKVKIEYPYPAFSDSVRFTAEVNQAYEFLGQGDDTALLNPLNFTVDEDVSSGYVVIDGASAALRDTLDIGTDAGEIDLTVATYDLRMHTLPNGKKNDTRADKEEAYNKGTKSVKLTVAAYDLSGNLGSATPTGGDPIFDNKAAVISKLFPNNEDLADYDNKIGGSEETQHPVFRLNERVDSIVVRYEGGGGLLSVVGTAAQNNTVGTNIKVKFLGDKALQQNEIYDLQVYVRDLAGHVTISDNDSDETGAQPEEGLTFDSTLSNPSAGAFKLATNVRGITSADAVGFVAMDSVVAGQAMRLSIKALDAALTASSGKDRKAITYSGDNVKVVTMDSDGNPVSAVKYWGGGVTNNGDGTATLNDLGWASGERDIFLSSTLAGSFTVAVKDMNADGVVNFMKTANIVVDAADFAQFEITAWKNGQSVTEVWGDFDLLVMPTDRYGNPSLKTFHGAKDGKIAPIAAQDSLDILDSRINKGAKSTKKYTNVDVNFSASLVEDLPFSWSIQEAGDTFSVRTAENRTRGTARVRAVVDNSYLNEDDDRSRNKSGDASFKIQTPLTPVLAADMTGDIAVPETVTVTATGFSAGSTVTFTVGGVAEEKTADADGSASVEVAGTEAGTVTVSAASGQYSTDAISIVFVEAPAGRQSYADADGNPVYLIAKSSGTVGVDDFLALIAAFGSSDGDANYSLQADVNDDGTVDVDDFLAFIGSFGRTAVGPSTKPLVLLPGINENAEFALSLGSERVVAGELVAVDVSLANVAAVMGYGFTLNYDVDKFEFISAVPADEDLLKSTGGETPLFHHLVADGQVEVVNGVVNGTAVSGGGDIVRFVFRVLYEFEDNARFEIADGLVFDPSQLSNPAVIAGVLELQSTPREFALHQNFPNPFNPDTTIKYELAESADVTLQIYNVLGQVVRTLVASEAQNAGRYQIRWNGMDDRGVSVSSGVYFYRISAEGKFQNVRKLMLLK